MSAIPIDEQVRCIERELSMREHLYPRWVAEQKMSTRKMDTELATMKAVLETLKRLQAAERLL